MLHELRVRQPAHLEGREQILLEDRPVLVLVIRQRRRGTVATGIVHQQGKRRTEIGDPVEHGEAIFLLSQVCTERQHLDAWEVVQQLHTHLFQVISIACHQQQVGAEAGQLTGSGVTDALAGTGDQGGVSLQLPGIDACVHASSLEPVHVLRQAWPATMQV